MVGEVVLGNVMADCDGERKLQGFYGELSGWEICELSARLATSSSLGIVFLFIEERDYVPPVWSGDTGKQQKQMHFDPRVDNVTEMAKRAEPLRAKKAESQFRGNDLVTMSDPAGHPFCLCRKRQSQFNSFISTHTKRLVLGLTAFFVPEFQIGVAKRAISLRICG